jgi:hypothetical protein
MGGDLPNPAAAGSPGAEAGAAVPLPPPPPPPLLALDSPAPTYEPDANPPPAATQPPVVTDATPGQVHVYIAGPHGESSFIYGDPNKKCQCSIGWILFGLGWAVPILWYVGVFVFCCTKNVHDKRAAIANGVMSMVSIALLIAAIVLMFVPVGQSSGYNY